MQLLQEPYRLPEAGFWLCIIASDLLMWVAAQLQLGRLSELESHFASLGVGASIPDLAQTSSYLDVLAITSGPIQVAPPRYCVLTRPKDCKSSCT